MSVKYTVLVNTLISAPSALSWSSPCSSFHLRRSKSEYPRARSRRRTQLPLAPTTLTRLVHKPMYKRQHPSAPPLWLFQRERRRKQVVVPHEARVPRPVRPGDSEVGLERVGDVVRVSAGRVSSVRAVRGGEKGSRKVKVLGQVDLLERVEQPDASAWVNTYVICMLAHLSSCELRSDLLATVMSCNE
jgi:hypothetical protein